VGANQARVAIAATFIYTIVRSPEGGSGEEEDPEKFSEPTIGLGLWRTPETSDDPQ